MKKHIILTLLLVVNSLLAFAQDTNKIFTVKDGAFPWYDRVNKWALAEVPASLAGAVVPQQCCADRSLNVVGTAAAITLAVGEKDLGKFKQTYPMAVETGERISVKNAAGSALAYVILKFPNPPKKISGQFSSGLILLKIEPGSGESAPKTEDAKSESGNTEKAKAENAKTESAKVESVKTENAKVEKVPVVAKGMFVVADGSFPWSDRVGAWALADVPASLAGAVLPQQNCASRSLNVVGTPAAITLAVSEKDLEAFKQIYPTAVETGERISVKHVSKDQVLAYVILKFPNPPKKISGQFSSGLILLKIEPGSGENTKTPSEKAAVEKPATLAPTAFVMPQKKSFKFIC